MSTTINLVELLNKGTASDWTEPGPNVETTKRGK